MTSLQVRLKLRDGEEIDVIQNDLVPEGKLYIIDREASFGDVYDPDEHGTKIAWLCRDPLSLVQRIQEAQRKNEQEEQD